MAEPKYNCSYKELVELHKLVPNPKNPNIHPIEQIERLARLIDYQGQRHPIIVSKKTGFVVAGHGRLEAIAKLGWEKAAVDYQDFENDAQEYAFIVSDNSIADWAELNKAQINKDFLDLGPEFDIEMLGIKDFVIEPFEHDLEEVELTPTEELNKKWIIEVQFPNEMEMRDILDDLVHRGYLAKEK